jgi:uncharacterized membrane protein
MSFPSSPIPLDLPQPTPEEIFEGPQALKEAVALEKGLNLDNRQQLNKFNSLSRADKFDDHLHFIMIFGLYALFAIVAMMFVTIALQYVLPDKWRYLSEDDTYKLQEFLFSGVIGGIIATLSKRIISGNGDD